MIIMLTVSASKNDTLFKKEHKIGKKSVNVRFHKNISASYQLKKHVKICGTNSAECCELVTSGTFLMVTIITDTYLYFL